MASTVVANASPLILLSRGGHLELLHNFADRVLVPQGVADEIRLKGAEDVTAKALDRMRCGLYLARPVLEEALKRVDE